MLRQKQLEVLQNVYEGRDVVVWFPTGYGKSVCYQLLPYMLDVKFSRASAPPSKRTKPWTSYTYLLRIFHPYTDLRFYSLLYGKISRRMRTNTRAVSTRPPSFLWRPGIEASF